VKETELPELYNYVIFSRYSGKTNKTNRHDMINMKLSLTGQEKGDLLMQASAWAGLTVLFLSSDESIHVSVTFN
jgi:hypothetical protein